MTVFCRRGSRGPVVVDCQNALNANLRPSPRLTPDGDFGPATDTAVRAFQRQEGLMPDGIVGNNTNAALMVSTEAYPPIMHDLRLIPQPSLVTCWAAATAMMTRSTPQGVMIKTPAHLVDAQGAINTYSDQDDQITGHREFARLHGIRYHPPQSHPVSSLRGLLKHSPIMLMSLLNPESYAKGLGSPGHMSVLVGMRGDADPSGRGTSMTFLDPWPVGRGARLTFTYHKITQTMPLLTFGMFTRM